MDYEPLFDLSGRTVCLTPRLPLEFTIDFLLRLHADPEHWKKPITLYLGLNTDFQRPLRAVEALALCGIIASLRSPTNTVCIGLATGYEALVLAAGKERHLLPQSLVSVGENELELPNGNLGLNPSGSSYRIQAQEQIHSRIDDLIQHLKLSPDLWRKPQILSATQAVKFRLADKIVPQLNPPLPFYAPTKS